MHRRQQAPPAVAVAAPGQHAQLLAAKLGPGRGVAGGPEGARLAAVAGQLHLTDLGHGLQAQTVSLYTFCFPDSHLLAQKASTYWMLNGDSYAVQLWLVIACCKIVYYEAKMCGQAWLFSVDVVHAVYMAYAVKAWHITFYAIV